MDDDLKRLAEEAMDLARKGNLRGAIEVHKRIIETWKESPSVVLKGHGLIADLYMKLRQPQQAEEHLKQALEIRPDAAPYLSLLGSAQALQGRIEESTASHRRAIELLPDHPEPLRMFGESLAAAGLLKEAEDVLLDCLKVGKEHIPTYISLAKLLTSRGKFAEARELLEAALADRPDNELLKRALRSLETHALSLQEKGLW